ncbi:MAG: hypothetical protein ABFD91_04040 [Anaerohalosphaeraceae bacterium]
MAGSSNFQQWNPEKNNQKTDVQYEADILRADGAPSSAPTGAVFPSGTWNKFAYQVSTFITAFCNMMAAKGYEVSDAALATLQAELANVITESDLQNSDWNATSGITQILNKPDVGGYGTRVLFTSSGTFTVPAGVKRITVLAVGGGSGPTDGVGGGGGGGATFATLDVSEISTLAITIGAGGAVGYPGGTTSVGTLVYAYGGQLFPAGGKHGAHISTGAVLGIFGDKGISVGSSSYPGIGGGSAMGTGDDGSGGPYGYGSGGRASGSGGGSNGTAGCVVIWY